jgi:hypothetical protein
MISARTLPRAAAALGITGALALIATPVMAASGGASGGGAQVVNESGCQTTSDGTQCSKTLSVVKAVTTPSGVENSVDIGRVYSTTSHPDGTTDWYANTYRDHSMTRGGELQERSTHVDFSAANCTYLADIHYANGAYQFHRINLDCPH